MSSNSDDSGLLQGQTDSIDDKNDSDSEFKKQAMDDYFDEVDD